VRALRRREPDAHLQLGEAASVASRAASAEEAVSQRDLLDHLLAQIPMDQRRIVILVEMWGLTIREAAAVVRSSTTRAHARHQSGMATLREAAERWRQEQGRRGVLALPLPPAALFAAALPDEAPADGDERTWRLATAALALRDAPPEREAPCAGTRTADDGPDPAIDRGAARGRGTARWPARLGLLLLGPIGFVVGVLVARDPRGREPATATAANVAASAARAPAEQVDAAPPVATATLAATAAPVAAKAATARTSARPPRETEDERLRAERALVDRGRAALSAGNVTAALEALAEHARHFPRGQSAGTCERLWSEACAEAPADARCAARR